MFALIIGSKAGSNGTYEISGGTLNVTDLNGATYIGYLAGSTGLLKVIGEFANAAWGTEYSVGGETYTLTNSFGSGNDVGLTTGPYIPPFRLPGDADLNDVVDAADAAILASNWLTLTDATWAMGDFNGDEMVTDIDATIMATNWSVAAQGVPEPSALAGLLGLCLAGFLALARRKR